MVFDLQIADPAVQAYLQNGLAQGQLGFVISSLHDAGLLGGDNPFVNLATANHFAVAGPKFEMTMSMIDVGLPGDFDANGTLDINDVNQLTTVIRNGSNDVALDLSGDSLVTTADLNLWVHDLFGSYFGDANLDGEFTSGDLVAVFSAGQYEDSIPGNSTWSTGDWNADGEFNTSDLVTAFQDGGYEQGPRATVAAVPEPNSLFAWILGALSAVSLRRIARK
jgi:hypothetical protein